MTKIAELRRKLGVAVDELTALVEDAAAFTAKEAEIEALEAQIKRSETAQTRSAGLARPATLAVEPEEGATDISSIARMSGELGALRRNAGGNVNFGDALSVARRGVGWSQDNSRHFRSLGDQLIAVQQYYVSRGANTDARLTRAPLGAGEVDPTGGGFLVQTDFASAVFMLAHNMGELLSRVGKIAISERSNSLKIPAVDETSRANGSRFGGVTAYWAGEGAQPAYALPKFREVTFALHKLIGLMPMTDELLQDAPALTQIAGQAFSEEITFKTEDAIYRGGGDGLPLGILKSPAFVAVPKVTGQATGTIIKENIDAMFARCWARSFQNAVWLINQLCYPQLFGLAQVVGTGGAPVWLPPGGMSAAPFGTLYGRPVVPVEYCEAPGTVGDIMLADLSQYQLVDKGGVTAATSMHVAFLTDQQVFRITYRVDGKPMWSAPLLPYKGAQTLSPFVGLASR